MASSAGVVSSATAFSRVLGLVREQVMAAYFGASNVTDAFLAAFRIPNLLRDMFAEGALSQAFIPIFKEKLVKSDEKDAFKLADVVITAILVVVGVIVLLGIVVAPVIVYISANGFTEIPDKFDLTVSLTRLMMVYLLLVSLSAMVMGMLNSYGKFGIPAISPAMFNLGIIGSVLILYRYLDQPIYTLAIGVLLGGLAQLVIQLPALLKIGYRFKLSFNFLDESLKRVVNLITPMIIGMSASRINILLNTLLASFLMEGSLSFLNYSYRLMHFPLGVFAVALGTVALPKVSELVASRDSTGLKKTFEDTINLNLVVIIPSAVFLAVMGREIVNLIYTWGAFGETESANTALALMHYSYGLIGFAAVRVTVPFFYAHKDSKLPMRASLVAVVVNMLLYYPLIKILNFAGLAAATSVAGVVNFIILLIYLPRKGIDVSPGRIGLSVFKISLTALFAFYAARFIPIHIYDGSSLLLIRLEQLFVPSILGLLIYIILAVAFDFPMMRSLFGRLFKAGK